MRTKYTPTWVKVWQAPNRGHRYFISITSDKNKGRLSCADWSGNWPDETDDGILWVDFTRPLVLHKTGISVPLLCEREGNTSHTGESLDALPGLLRLHRHTTDPEFALVLGDNACLAQKALLYAARRDLLNEVEVEI